VRAEFGRGNPGVGGTVDVFIGSGRSCLLVPWLATVVVPCSLTTASLTELSLWQDEQLLDREEVFDKGEDGREDVAGAVLVREVEVAVLEFELMDAVVDIESEEGADMSAGLLSGKVNRFEVAGPADMGLIRVGESLERKSR
jgi:hypothetical protein